MNTRSRSVEVGHEDSILASFVSLGGGVILSRIVAFVGTAYLARTLGTYAFGIIGFATALTAFLALGLRMGFEPIGAREVARDRESASRLAAGVGLIRLAIAIVGLAILTLIALYLDRPREVRHVIVLTGLLLIPWALDPRWVYRGLGRNRSVGFSMVMAQVVYVAILLVRVKSPEDLFWAPLALVVGETVAMIFLALPLFWGGSGGVDWNRAWRVLRSSGFLVSSGMLGALIRTTGIVLIAMLLGEAQVGIFSAAYRVCYLILAIAVALHSAYQPRLARVTLSDPSALRQTTFQAFEAAASLAIPFVVGGWILATPILTHLFGPAFAGGRDAFRLLLLAMGLFFLHGIYFHLLVAFDRTRPELVIRGSAAALNLLLNLLLIPHFGIEGAAMATVLAEVVVLIWRSLACRQLGVTVSSRFLWKPFVAAAGMAVVILWMEPRFFWLLTFAAGGLSYIVFLLLLGGMPTDLRPRFLQQ